MFAACDRYNTEPIHLAQWYLCHKYDKISAIFETWKGCVARNINCSDRNGDMSFAPM